MAENELNERKRRNDEQQRANITLAEQKSPQIKELRRRLISGGSRLASVLISEGDPRLAVQGIAKENLSIRKKIKELFEISESLDFEIYTSKTKVSWRSVPV